MMLKIDTDKLYEVIKAFYTITRIKIAVYSSDFEEIAAYPQEQRGLCGLMDTCDRTRDCCRLATKALFEQCRDAEGHTVSHRCHAGLTEVAAPLLDNGQTIGYVIFGQITDEPDRELFTKDVLRRCSHYGFAKPLLRSLVEQVHFVSEEQISSLSFILSMITSYITTHHLAYSSARPPVYEILDYICSHLAQNLSVDALCSHFLVSRSCLYQITKPCMPDGVAEYVRTLRLQKAKELLVETDTPIWQIAERVGFRDYDYFLRSFKKYAGISAGQYRKKEQL